MKKSTKIKYYKDKSTGKDPRYAFVYINEDWSHEGNHKTCYAPIGQHSAIDPAYLDQCDEITKEEYIQISEGLYTPAEYL